MIVQKLEKNVKRSVVRGDGSASDSAAYSKLRCLISGFISIVTSPFQPDIQPMPRGRAHLTLCTLETRH
jgi:hypothetical protein